MEPESFENRVRAMDGSVDFPFDEAPFRSCHASALAQLPGGRLETAPGDYSYPAMIAADDGIAISYTWKRRGIRSWVFPLAALDATETRGD